MRAIYTCPLTSRQNWHTVNYVKYSHYAVMPTKGKNKLSRYDRIYKQTKHVICHVNNSWQQWQTLTLSSSLSEWRRGMVILHHLPIFTWFGAVTSHFFFLQKNRLNRGKSGHFFTQKPRSNRREQKRVRLFGIQKFYHPANFELKRIKTVKAVPRV